MTINARRITEIIFITFLWLASSVYIYAHPKLKIAPASDPYLNLIRLIGNQKYDEVIAQGFKLIESNTSSQRACERIVEAARASKQLNLMQSRFESLLQLSPPNPFGFYGLGLIYEENNNVPAAIASYQSFLKAKPLCPTAIQKVIRLICASGNYAEAETYVRSVLDLSDDPALAQFALGSYYAAIGKTEEAIVELDKATTSELLRADAYYSKAATLSEAERYLESLETVKNCLSAIEPTLDYDQKLSFWRMLVSHSLSAGDYLEAGKAIERIQHASQLVGDSQAEEFYLGYSGILNHIQAKYSIALSFYLKSIEVTEKHGRLANVGRTLGNIASLYSTLGDISTAIKYYEIALPISLKAGDERNYAALLLRFGGLYMSQNDIPKALAYYQQLIDFQQNRHNRPGLRLAIEATAIVYLRTGDYVKARELIQKGLNAARVDRTLPNEFSLLNLLGELHLRTKSFADAIEAYQQMLRLSKDSGYLHYDWAAHAGIGLAYEKQGKFDKARESYRTSIQVFENVRTGLGIENNKIGYFQDKAEIYRRLVGVLMKLHAREPDGRFAAEAFHFSERSRARALLDSLNEISFTKHNLSTEQQKQQQLLLSRFSKLEADLLKARAELNPDANKIKVLRGDMLKASEELKAWQENVRRQNPRFPEPLTVEQVQQMLRNK